MSDNEIISMYGLKDNKDQSRLELAYQKINQIPNATIASLFQSIIKLEKSGYIKISPDNEIWIAS